MVNIHGFIIQELITLKGGKGSGFYGHVGRPGKRGGSAPKSGGGVSYGRKVVVLPVSISKKVFTDQEKASISKRITVGGKPPTKEELEIIIEQLSKHPKAVVLNGLRELIYCDNDVDFLRELNGDLVKSGLPMRRKTDIEGTYGYHFDDDAKIVMRKLPDASDDSLLDHEMGHVVWRMAKTFRSKWNNGWKSGNLDRLTLYSEDSPHEGFAESYMTYMSCGGRIKSKVPKIKETFDFIDEVIQSL